MRSRMEGERYRYKRPTHVRERPLHWFIVLISYSFIFLLILEAVALIVLGAWFLSIPRLNNVLSFSDEIYRRELGFGILLVVLGSLGIFISILGIVATIMLRISILRLYAACLWLLLLLGIGVGIVGIVFSSQVDGFMDDDRKIKPNLLPRNYYTEKFLLGMCGGLTLFMSLTLLVGIIIVLCFTIDPYSRSDDDILIHSK